MSDNNRINQVSISQTTPRQTPNNDFGTVMARTMATAVRAGTGVAGVLTMGNPVLSAAVGNIASAVSAVTSTGGAVAPVGGSSPGSVGGAAGAGGAAGGNSEWDLMEAQKLMRSEDRKFNLEYLQLQNTLQKESREFNAVSNIMKVRHDSAKAAINNIR